MKFDGEYDWGVWINDGVENRISVFVELVDVRGENDFGKEFVDDVFDEEWMEG